MKNIKTNMIENGRDMKKKIAKEKDLNLMQAMLMEAFDDTI
jgi:hypothetical protein